MAWQKINIPIPEDLKPSERIELAGLIIDKILEKTDKGVDRNGKPFPKYEKEYLLFKYGDKKNRKPDLRLSSEMLEALRLLSHKSGNLSIGFENGTTANDKAEGNILGSYGRSPNPAKARDFLGVKKKELEELISYVEGNSVT